MRGLRLSIQGVEVKYEGGEVKYEGVEVNYEGVSITEQKGKSMSTLCVLRNSSLGNSLFRSMTTVARLRITQSLSAC